jgi:CDP-6-deoxy-D-xylo-4-hexulose-3-dehydrase
MDDKHMKDEIEEFVVTQLMLKPVQTEFIPGVTPIGIADAQLGKEEVEALVRASLDLRIVDGKITHAFELELARFLGVRYATCCNSGSSANLLAFMALTSPKLGSRAIVPGDEVIVCAVGFPTTVAPIIQAGAIPVFVDVSLVTYNPTPKMIAEAITDKTKAIFLANTLGNKRN